MATYDVERWREGQTPTWRGLLVQLPFWLEKQGCALVPFGGDLDGVPAASPVEVWMQGPAPGVLMHRDGRRLGVIRRN